MMDPASVFSTPGKNGYFIEAEHFDKHGGWVEDAQFVDQMGSACLLAHGMGKPVEDAVTTLRDVERGTYRLWVRTRDWTHETGHAAGRFQVVIDGKTVQREFGSQSGEWGWEDGGLVELGQSGVELCLRDLTGFGVFVNYPPGIRPRANVNFEISLRSCLFIATPLTLTRFV